jgi:hypothetical protein
MATLDAARIAHPADRDILEALMTFHRDAGGRVGSVAPRGAIARARPMRTVESSHRPTRLSHDADECVRAAVQVLLALGQETWLGSELKEARA